MRGKLQLPVLLLLAGILGCDAPTRPPSAVLRAPPFLRVDSTADLVAWPPRQLTGLAPRRTSAYVETASLGSPLVISHRDLGILTLVGTRTNEVTGEVDVTPRTPGVMAFARNRTRVYVTSEATNELMGVDIRSGEVVVAIGVGPEPLGIALARNGATAYVAHALGVSVVNLASGSVTAEIALPSLGSVIDLAPNRPRAYVTRSTAGAVNVIDLVSNTVVQDIAVESALALAVSPDGSLLFVTQFFGGLFGEGLTVIETAGHTVVKVLEIDGGVGLATPSLVVFEPRGRFAYLTHFNTPTVSVIDVARLEVIGTITVEQFPFGIAASPDGRSVYVANFGASSISVIDIERQAMTDLIAVQPNPGFLAIPSTVDPFAALTDLLDEILALGLPAGLAQALTAQLNAALLTLEQDLPSTKHQLMAFMNLVEAQSGKKLSEADAEDLIEWAEDILSAIDAAG